MAAVTAAAKVMKPCATPGCPELVAVGRCAKCAPGFERSRGTTAERGYDSAHERLRAQVLREEPFCQIRTHCQGAVATEMDHVIPIRLAPELRLERSNVQSACKPCNAAKARLDGSHRRVAIRS